MEEMEFRISSGLKSIIGKELITDDRIALFELVKNSYDANAKKVEIVFIDTKTISEKKARILVVDDGDGMSYDDINQKFLFVGYSEKKEFEKQLALEERNFREKLQKKRIVAGAKGVGRFSCDRLGEELNLFTKKENEDLIHHVHIDWGRFEENQQKEFQKVKVQYNKIEKLDIQNHTVNDFRKGTILEIISLNDRWDWAKLIRLKRYLQRLINPAQIDTEEDFTIFLTADEYREKDKKSIDQEKEWNVVNGPIKNVVFEKLGIKTTEIKCVIDGDGKSIVMEQSDKGQFVYRIKEKNIDYNLLKGIRVKLFFLNTEAKSAFSRTMGLQPVKYGSVFLYKNGVRIHPYGDEGDDWLGLEKRKGQGYARFLGTRELMGRIEIYGYQPGFIEVSSRDGGIIKNDHYLQLTEFFVKKILRRLEKYVVEGIEWEKKDLKKTPQEIKEDSLKILEKMIGRVKDPDKEVDFNKNLLEIVEEKEVEKIPEIIKNVDSLKKYVKKPEVRNYIDKQLKAFRRATEVLREEKKEVEQKKERVEKILEVTKKEALFLSATISEDKEILINLNHSVKVTTFTIENYIREIYELIRLSGSYRDISHVVEKIDRENQKIRVLSGIVSFATFDTKVETIKKDLVQYIKEYLEGRAAKRIISKRIKGINVDFKNSHLKFIKRFKPLEVSIIFDNLMDNSQKAGASTISIMFEIIGKELHILFSDNGKGVEKGKEAILFSRGSSTTGGSGIGLFHVKTILESIGGEIKFVGNGFGDLEKGACFEMVIR